MRFERTYILPTLVKIGSPKFRRYILDLFPWKNLHKLRDIVDIMDETTVSILNSKKKALEEGEEAAVKQVGKGKDIISILSQYSALEIYTEAYFVFSRTVKANMEASEADRLPESDVLGQVWQIYVYYLTTNLGPLKMS